MESERVLMSRQRMAESLNISAGDDLDIDDVWYDETALMDDHIIGILSKWDSIDDQIWAKIVVMEKNHRVAKAFVRSPVLTVNGGEVGFDGEVVGLAGFDNTLRDSDTESVINMVGEGCRLKMDEGGNIMVKRISKEKIFCRSSNELGDTKDAKHLELGLETPHKLFDMRKFQHTISRELRRDEPDWRKVRQQAICSLSFVQGCVAVIDQPVWVLVINIVALDLLRSRLDSINKVTLAGDDEIIGTTRDKQKCKGEKDSDPYFSGLKARVPPFVIQENDLQHQQVLGHPVSWHRKVAPCPPVRKCSK